MTTNPAFATHSKPRLPTANTNSKANAKAFKRMSLAERATGMTGEELTAYQRELRAEFLARRAG